MKKLHKFVSSRKLLDITASASSSPEPTSFRQVFKRASQLGVVLGLFPVTNAFAPANLPLTHRICSFPVLFSIFVVTSASALLVQPTFYYIGEADNGLKHRATDTMALRGFIACLSAIRLVTPFLSLYKTKWILRLAQDIEHHDTQFQVRNKNRLVDRHVVVLVLGSFLSVLSNWYVSKEDYQNLYEKLGSKLISNRLGGRLRFFRAVFTMAGHLYGEIAVMLMMAVMLFLTNCIKFRIHELEQDIRSLVEQSKENQMFQEATKVMISPGSSSSSTKKKMHLVVSNYGRDSPATMVEICSKKVEGLTGMVASFNETFGLFVFVSKALNLIMLVCTSYLLIIWVMDVIPYYNRNPPSDQVSAKMGAAVGATSTAAAFTLFRCWILINIGERMQTSGQGLAAVIAGVDTSVMAYGLARRVGDMRWMTRNSNFHVNACGFFVLNRQLITSIFGSVATFTIVLTQFRMAEW